MPLRGTPTSVITPARLRFAGLLLLLLALVMVVSTATEVIIDDFVHPRTLFYSLLISSVITTALSLVVDIDLEG